MAMEKKKLSSSMSSKKCGNWGEIVRKQRTPTRYDPNSVLDDEVTSAAISLILLSQDKTLIPQLSWKEENLVSVFPQNFRQEFKKPSTTATGESKITSDQNKRQRPVLEENIEGKIGPVVKKARRSLIPVLENMNNIPELPMNFKIRIRNLNGSAEDRMVFVYEKPLSRTDVNPDQNRLLIPLKQLKNDEFLTENEKGIISGKGTVEALLIQPSLDECNINLRKWDMGGKCNGNVSQNYVLVTTWNKVVKENRLAEGMKVQLWSFRRGDQLTFALVNQGY